MTFPRIILLALCVAVGWAVGFVGELLSGSQSWYLAIPGAIAAGWFAVANPERCTAKEPPRNNDGAA